MNGNPDEEDIEFGVLEEIIIEVRDASPRVQDDAASADIAEAIWNAGYRRAPEDAWEYGVLYAWHDDIENAVTWGPRETAEDQAGTDQGDKIVRRRKAGFWETA